ncbi:MAG: hypothetical protein LBD75_04480 [Candidatus Peribacteria bacterium]|jgi:predicted RNA methylase|nr:hypothetical protein [Candidatus Peribacteria bacterium]
MYKKLPFPCHIKSKKAGYFFQLNTFLEIYEQEQFWKEIFNNDAQIFIDVGGNIGRVSSMVAAYTHYEKIFTVEPNPTCAKFMKEYIPSTFQKKIEILNY